MTQSNQSNNMPNHHPQDSFTKDELLECGHARLFGPGNAQLPLPPMLMFDRIITINKDGGDHHKGLIIAELDVDPSLWFFDCHFEGDRKSVV